MTGQTVVLLVCAVVIVAAFAGTVHLKRASDRAWAFHVATRPLLKDWIRFQVEIRDHLTPALTEAAAALSAMGPQLTELGRALRKAGIR